MTAGSNGALMVLPLDSPAAAQSIMQPRSSASYAAVCWSSPQAFVSAGTSGSTASAAVTEALLLPNGLLRPLHVPEHTAGHVLWILASCCELLASRKGNPLPQFSSPV